MTTLGARLEGPAHLQLSLQAPKQLVELVIDGLALTVLVIGSHFIHHDGVAGVGEARTVHARSLTQGPQVSKEEHYSATDTAEDRLTQTTQAVVS